jgi:hypothetical protein
MLQIARNASRRPWPELRRVSREFGVTEGWITTLDFAAERKVPFWCDDYYLRELARSYGVVTFSTEDVLRQLELMQKVNSQNARIMRLALARASYVDLEYGYELLKLAIAADSYAPRGVADILSHQSSWGTPETAINLLLHALIHLDRDKFEAYAGWIMSAANGLAKASSDPQSKLTNLSVLLENVLSLHWTDAEHVPIALDAVRTAASNGDDDLWHLTLQRIYVKLRQRYPPSAAKSILMASVRLCSEDDRYVAARTILTSEL